MNNIILRDYIRPNYGSVDKPEAKSQTKVCAQVKSKKGKRNLAYWSRVGLYGSDRSPKYP